MTVRDIDRGWNQIRKLAQLGPVVDVGFLGVKGSQRHSKSRQSVAQIASYHEYGVQLPSGKWRPPKRSMIFDWVKTRQKAIVEASATIAGALVERRITQAQAIGQLGAFAQGDMQERIARGIKPPLKESTIRRKGSSTPLIDTGQMRASISHRPSR